MHILIPIEKFSFFVHACYNNIKSTSKNVEVVFITSENTTTDVKDAIKTIKCKEIQVPLNFNGCDKVKNGFPHQIMLDYAIKDKTLSDWVMVQHCDLFWTNKGWAEKIVRLLKKNKTTICHPQYLKYDVPLVGDYFGVYNRKKIIEQNLTFKCGYVGELSMSNKLLSMIENKQIPNIAIGDWIDGSVAMSLELAITNQISLLDLSHHFYHLMAFYRINESLSQTDSKISSWLPLDDCYEVPKQKWAEAFAAYSFLTSLAFEKHEVDKLLPWSIFKEILTLEKIDFNDIIKCCELIKASGPTPRFPLGSSNGNISEIKFADKVLYNNGNVVANGM